MAFGTCSKHRVKHGMSSDMFDQTFDLDRNALLKYKRELRMVRWGDPGKTEASGGLEWRLNLSIIQEIMNIRVLTCLGK